MLNEEQCQLLTLFVDGEATPKQRRAVAELVRESPEARRLLHALQQDADQLQALPHLKLPETFSQAVLDQIGMRGLHRPAALIAIPRPRRMSWVSRAAIAAAVLAAVSAATYLFALRSAGPNSAPALASSQPARLPLASDKPGAAAARPKNDAPTVAATRSEMQPPALSAADVEWLGAALADLTDPIVHFSHALSSAGIAMAPAKRSADGVLTHEPIGASRLKTVSPHLPPLEDFRTMDDARIVDQLKDGGFQLVDISCQESWKALDRFEAACRANGFRIIVDADAVLRRSKKMPAMYVVYIENIASDKVAKILHAAQAEDRKAEAKIKNDVQFNSVLVLPLEESWRKWLAEMLAVAPAGFVHPKAASKSPASTIDTTKPLPLDTQKSLEKLGSGGPPAGKTGAKEPTVLIMVNGPARSPMQMSKEIKQFLEAAAGLQPDVVHALFVLRPAKG